MGFNFPTWIVLDDNSMIHICSLLQPLSWILKMSPPFVTPLAAGVELARSLATELVAGECAVEAWPFTDAVGWSSQELLRL